MKPPLFFLTLFFSLKMVSYKTFNGFVFRESKSIVCLGSPSVPIFGSLPELSGIRTRKERPVFLRLVLKNCPSFAFQFLRADRYGHFNFIHIPLLPCTSIEPDPAIFCPVVLFYHFKSFEDGCQADAVGTVRLRYVAGCIDLLRLDLSVQAYSDLVILNIKLDTRHTSNV